MEVFIFLRLIIYFLFSGKHGPRNKCGVTPNLDCHPALVAGSMLFKSALEICGVVNYYFDVFSVVDIDSRGWS